MRLSSYTAPGWLLCKVGTLTHEDKLVRSDELVADSQHGDLAEALNYAAQLKVERDRLAKRTKELEQYIIGDLGRVQAVLAREGVEIPATINMQVHGVVTAYERIEAELDAAIAARDSLARRVEALERVVERQVEL